MNFMAKSLRYDGRCVASDPALVDKRNVDTVLGCLSRSHHPCGGSTDHQNVSRNIVP